jgi:DNA-binding transcriptional LysR family regulator
VFCLVVRKGSLSAAAQDLGLTTAAVSKRISGLESRLGMRLLNRTTRRMELTEEGQAYLEGAERLIAEFDEVESAVISRKAAPKGLLRVNATFGFGRHYVAPAVAEFARRYPDVQVQLQLSDRYLNLAEEGFDVGIHVGELKDSSLVSRKLLRNRRVLCAAPEYLRQFGVPKNPRELIHHRCLVLREKDSPYGVWRFRGPQGEETVKVRAALACNDSDVVQGWALAGLGIMLRSTFAATPSVRSGKLQVILDGYRSPEADVHAVYSHRHNLSGRVRVFVDFLAEWFAGLDTLEAG